MAKDKPLDQEKHDSEVKTRTAKYDQEVKIKAKKLGINPDNFATESELKQAIKKVEDSNDIR